MSTNICYGKEVIYHAGMSPEDKSLTGVHWGYYISTSDESHLITFCRSFTILRELERLVLKWLEKNYPKIGAEDTWDENMVYALVAGYAYTCGEDQNFIVEVIGEIVHGKVARSAKMVAFVERLTKVEVYPGKGYDVKKMFKPVEDFIERGK
jgi:hypothetical protein